MAGSYRRKTTTGAGGVKRTVTQKQGGGVTNTMSYNMGTGHRTAYTRKANGSVVQTKTHRTADGYVKRETKTIVPKYKAPKAPKPVKIPKLKTSIVKPSKPVKLKPYKAPKTVKSKPFKWPTAKRSTSRTRKASGASDTSFFGPFLLIMAVLFVFALIFG